MAKINLAHLLDINLDQLNQYKFHAAVWNGWKHPLDDFIKDGKIAGRGDDSLWWGWQAYHEEGKKDRWTRQYIVSFMQFYPEGIKMWLFGGIFEVKGKREDGYYDVHLTDKGKEWIGRLKVSYPEPKRQRYPYLENVYDDLEFSEMLKVRYSGAIFPGYENVSLKFDELEFIVNANKEDWKNTLSSVKGIYVIFDKETGKKYVGSAYGENGIWGRWCQYVEHLHGGNKELKKLLEGDSLQEIFQKEDSRDYVRKNFRFTMIEWTSYKNKTDDSYIIGRENFWKEALLSREFGYNAN